MEVKFYRKKNYILRELRTPERKRDIQKLKLTPIHKNKDRIMSELGNKSFEDVSFDESLNSNNATGSSGFMSNNSFEDIDSINIKLHYFINNKKNEIEIIINEDKTIKDLISLSLNLINEQLISDKQNIQLDTINIDNYCIKQIKNEEEELNDNCVIIDKDTFLSNLILENKFYLEWINKNKSNLIPYKKINNINNQEIQGLLMQRKYYFDYFCQKKNKIQEIIIPANI